MSTQIFTVRDIGSPTEYDRNGFVAKRAVGAKAVGLLFNKHAWWIGVHYSKHNKRVCINLLPCLTLWATQRGGTEP